MTSLLKINKLKIAVVGCGRIASRHFEAIETHSKYLSFKIVWTNILQN